MTRYYAQHGVTLFLATTWTAALESGKDADLVLFDDQITVVEGKLVYERSGVS